MDEEVRWDVKCFGPEGSEPPDTGPLHVDGKAFLKKKLQLCGVAKNSWSHSTEFVLFFVIQATCSVPLCVRKIPQNFYPHG